MNKQGKSVLVLAMIMVFIAIGLSLPLLGVNMAESAAAQTCPGDFDNDGDVDGTDLAEFAEDFGRTDCPPKAIATTEKTGQTTSFRAGDDGDLQRGLAWPIPRFTDNDDGTVTDNLTGLVWMKDAYCFDSTPYSTTLSQPNIVIGPPNRTWIQALGECSGLAAGRCGLTDGSQAGDWRLPNILELQSLIHYGVHSFAIPNTAGTGKWSEGDPFISVQWNRYWSSTTYADVGAGAGAWTVKFSDGEADAIYKSDDTVDVWCVRDGQ
jgi:hypothetical protein